MADVMTFEEHRGPIKGRKVAWTGDGNNVLASWVHAAEQFGFELASRRRRSSRRTRSAGLGQGDRRGDHSSGTTRRKR